MSADQLVFVDSNVLLYSLDSRDPSKRDLANQWLDALWSAGTGRLSWQVLNESYVNATGKLGVRHDAVRRSIELFAEWNTVETNLSLVRRAWHWVDQSGVNYWDSLIVAAAEQAGCRWLLSEDFQTGRRFGALSAVNPFRTAPGELLDL